MKNRLSSAAVAVAAFVTICTGAQDLVELTGSLKPVIKGYEDYRLYKSNRGYVMTKHPERAPRLYAEIERGAKEFHKRFDRVPSQGLVIEVPAGVQLEESTFAALETGWLFPLPSPDNKVEGMDSVEAGYRKFYKEKYPELTEKQLEASVANAMKILKKSNEDVGISVVAHELGHQWFDDMWKAVPRSVPAGTTRVYGSPAADYLDECAAILMESEKGLASRWAFMKKVHGDPTLKAKLKPIGELVTMEHPNTGGISADPNGANLFYSQCSTLIEFLLEKTKDDKIFLKITESALKGKTFEAWLKEDGPKNQLPSAMATLDAEWQQWVSVKLKALQ